MLGFVLGALISFLLKSSNNPKGLKTDCERLKMCKRSESLEVVMPGFKGKFISGRILCSLKLNLFYCDVLNYSKLKNYYNNICTVINLGISRGIEGAVSTWIDVTLHKHSPFNHSIKLLLNIGNYAKLSFFPRYLVVHCNEW